MKKGGIREVAKIAEVSIGTVSKVLNPDSESNIRVSPETREKVLAAARKLNYAADYGASLLRGGKSGVVGFIVNLPEELKTPRLSAYPLRILSGLSAAAAKEGYQLLLINGGDYESYLKMRRVDALVILGFRMVDNAGKSKMVEMFRKFNERNYPYVVINNVGGDVEVPFIGLDNRGAMNLIAEHIRKKGYRMVGFIGEQTSNPQTHHGERLSALADALENTGVAFPAELRFNGIGNGIPEIPRTGLYSQRDGAAVVEYLAEKEKLPRCLVCGNDTIAQGVLQEAYMRNIRVPEQLAVIGFDDTPGSEYFAPALTTIHQPLEEFGRLAFQFVRAKMDDPSRFEQTVIQPVLKERISG